MGKSELSTLTIFNIHLSVCMIHVHVSRKRDNRMLDTAAAVNLADYNY